MLYQIQNCFGPYVVAGGGTFGVVVEGTIKAHPDVPVTVLTWFLNSTAKHRDPWMSLYAIDE